PPRSTHARRRDHPPADALEYATTGNRNPPPTPRCSWLHGGGRCFGRRARRGRRRGCGRWGWRVLAIAQLELLVLLANQRQIKVGGLIGRHATIAINRPGACMIAGDGERQIALEAIGQAAQ